MIGFPIASNRIGVCKEQARPGNLMIIIYTNMFALQQRYILQQQGSTLDIRLLQHLRPASPVLTPPTYPSKTRLHSPT